MKWINAAGSLINFDEVKFVIKHINNEDNIFALRFHFSVEHYLEMQYLSEELVNNTLNNLGGILNGKTNMDNTPKNG